MRLLIAAALLGTLGCMTRFITGPGKDSIPPNKVSVQVDRCETPAPLFDCKTAPAVGGYLRDYLRLNGLKEAPAAKDVPNASLRIFEERGVVAIEVALYTRAGLAWRAEAQGDTLLRALVRFEKLLDAEAGFRGRLITHPELQKKLDELGRKELSAEANSFTYR